MLDPELVEVDHCARSGAAHQIMFFGPLRYRSRSREEVIMLVDPELQSILSVALSEPDPIGADNLIGSRAA
jgi:hypothetical protein